MIIGTATRRHCEGNSPATHGALPALRCFFQAITTFYQHDLGASVLETALMLPLLLTLLIGAVDYGRGYYAAIEVASAAESGALYGSLNPTDTSGMVSMAKLNAKDISGMNATAIYGCECSDGSSFILNCSINLTCSTNVVKYVEVTTAANYVPILPYPGIGSSLALKNKVRLRAAN
jgi:Flp pilus assembly protein TadG